MIYLLKIASRLRGRERGEAFGSDATKGGLLDLSNTIEFNSVVLYAKNNRFIYIYCGRTLLKAYILIAMYAGLIRMRVAFVIHACMLLRE